MESRQHSLTGLLLAIVIVTMIAGWHASADYFPTPVGYPVVRDLGTIANGGTATCSFRNAPVCHFTVASGSGGFTIGNPSSNPATAGQIIIVSWTQAASGYPSVQFGSAWFGYDAHTDSIDQISTQSPAFFSFPSYANAATGAPPLSFTWDGTEYILNVDESQQILQAKLGGTINVQSNYQLAGNALISGATPTISSGFGSGASVAGGGNTASFSVNVGTGGTASSGVIGLLATGTEWTCFCTDITTTSATVFMTKPTASANNSCTVGNFNDTGAAAAWVANDILKCTALGH